MLDRKPFRSVQHGALLHKRTESGAAPGSWHNGHVEEAGWEAVPLRELVGPVSQHFMD